MCSRIEIRRETDAARINRVSNLPDVHGFLAYHGKPLDWSTAFPSRLTGIVVLSDGEDATGVFVMVTEREWQGHTVFGPKCRGRAAIETGKAMLDYMSRYADRVWGATPLVNRKARWFNRQIGLTPIGTDEYEVEGPVEIVEKRYNAA